MLNGGITICATSLFGRDNDRKKISLKNASIINGAQTRGVIKKYIEDNDLFSSSEDLLVKVEIIISQDKEFFDDVSIDRNQQSAVRALSISGKKGLLDDLDLVTSESLKLDESQKDKFDTEKLIQLIFAIMPKEVWNDIFPNRDHRDKSVVYSSKATMFNKFSDIAENQKKSKSYRFFIDMAESVLVLYKYLQENKPVINKYLDVGNFTQKGYRINKSTNKVNILDGVIFPIISLCSQFVKFDGDKYSLNEITDDTIKSFTRLIVEYSDVIEHGNVQTLGKKAVSYKAPYDFVFAKKLQGNLESYHSEK